MTSRLLIWCGLSRRPMEETIFQWDIKMILRAAHALGVAERDVWALVCDRGLLPQSFVESCADHCRDAKLDEFVAVTNHIAEIASPDDRLLFVATNHGDRDGLLAMTEPPDEFDESPAEAEFLSPELFREKLDSIAGYQVALIATCYAGVFLDHANEKRSILAACGRDRTFTVDFFAQHPPRNPFLYELLSHWAGVSLANYEAPNSRPLRDAFDAIRDGFPDGACSGDLSWP